MRGARGKEPCGNEEGKSCGSRAQQSTDSSPSSESHSPLGVLQEQICFGLLREGLQGTEKFQEHDTGLCLAKAVGWEQQESLSCPQPWAHTSTACPAVGGKLSYLCLEPREGGEGAVKD